MQRRGLAQRKVWATQTGCLDFWHLQVQPNQCPHLPHCGQRLCWGVPLCLLGCQEVAVPGRLAEGRQKVLPAQSDCQQRHLSKESIHAIFVSQALPYSCLTKRQSVCVRVCGCVCKRLHQARLYSQRRETCVNAHANLYIAQHDIEPSASVVGSILAA